MNPSSNSPAFRNLTRRDVLRFGGVALGAAFGGSLLTSCAPSTGGAGNNTPTPLGTDPITLTMWTWDPGHIKFFKSQAQKWNAAGDKPQLTLNVEQIDPVTAATKLLAALTAGQAPDLAAIGVNDIALFFANGQADNTLTDLEPYIAGVKEQFAPAKWASYSNQGKAYAVESTMSPTAFYYRTDQFEKLELGSPPFGSIDDWLAAARKAKTNDKFIVDLDAGSTDVYPANWMQWFVQHGGNIFDVNGNIVFDQGGHAEAVTELYVNLLKDKLALPLSGANPDAIRSAAYKDGSLIAANGPDWWSTYILEPNVPEQKGKWAMAQIAPFGTGRSSTYGGAGFAIPKTSKKPNEAYAFLAHAYLTYEGQIDRWKSIQYFPTMTKAWSDPVVTDYQIPFYGEQKVGQVFAESAKSQPVFYTAAAAPEAQKIIVTELIAPAAQGSRPVSEGIRIATEKLKSAAG